MTEIILFYIMPNIVMFGSIIFASRLAEKMYWDIFIDSSKEIF